NRSTNCSVKRVVDTLSRRHITDTLLDCHATAKSRLFRVILRFYFNSFSVETALSICRMRSGKSQLKLRFCHFASEIRREIDDANDQSASSKGTPKGAVQDCQPGASGKPAETRRLHTRLYINA